MHTVTAKIAPPPPPAHQSRMAIAGVVTTRVRAPMRVLVHGVPKIGKTTFAASAPSPIFLCPEDGIPEELGAVPHFPQPSDGIWTWQDVLDAVRELTTSAHDYKTFVLDTLDWAEPLLWADVCEKAKVASIEDVGGGFAKGYNAAVDGWRTLLAALEGLRRAKGMHVILLAHSWIRAFKDPESEGYDRYELKIHKLAAGLWKEWVDAMLFAKHDDHVMKDKRTKRIRGISSGVRLFYTTHNAAYDAGNRYSLPETLPLSSWEELEGACVRKEPADPARLKAALVEKIGLLKAVSGELATKGEAALARAGDDASKLAQLNNWVNAQMAAAGGTEVTA